MDEEAIRAEYEEAWNYFARDLFGWALEIKDSKIVTSSEFSELEEAIRVGQKALRLGGLIEIRCYPEFVRERQELIEDVYELIQIKRNIFRDPSIYLVYSEKSA